MQRSCRRGKLVGRRSLLVAGRWMVNMLQLLLAMAAILATWFFLAVILVGLGLLVCRISAVSASSDQDVVYLFWIGWGASVMLLQVWHLWLAVDWRALATISLLGVVGILWGRRCLPPSALDLRETWKRAPWICVVAGVVIVAWANLAVGEASCYDTGLYHLTAVRWNSAYPIVPGLGNLSGRLAFNNASFLYASMLDAGPWAHRSHHLASGLPLLVVVLWLLWQTPYVTRVRNRNWSRSMFLWLLLPGTLACSNRQITSHSPDLFVFLLEIVLASQLIEIMFTDRRDVPRRKFLLCGICFLSAVGIAVKVSFAPFGVTATLVAAGFMVAKAGWVDVWRGSWRVAAVTMLLSLIVLGTWMVRGVYLSGYVAYPQSIGAFDVPWRIDAAEVVAMRHTIIAWARQPAVPPAEVLAGWNWIGPWLMRALFDVENVTLPLILAVAATLATVSVRWHSKGMPLRYQLVLLPSLVTLLFMLVTAPDFRFAGAATWILAAGAIVLSVGWISRADTAYRHRWRMLVWPCLVVLPIMVFKVGKHYNGPGDDHGFHSGPVAELQPRTTDSGLKVYVPTTGDQAWDAPLPNAPSFRADLRLRNENNLGDGFIAESGVKAAWKSP